MNVMQLDFVDVVTLFRGCPNQTNSNLPSYVFEGI